MLCFCEMALGRWSLLAEEQGLLGVDFRFSRSVGAIAWSWRMLNRQPLLANRRKQLLAPNLVQRFTL
jgi:hypothetical protein